MRKHTRQFESTGASERSLQSHGTAKVSWRSNSKSLSLLDLESGAVRAKPELGEADNLTDVELSPSGGQIAIGTYDGGSVSGMYRPRGINWMSNLLTIRHASIPAPVTCIAFQADSRRVAAVTGSGALSVWDIGTSRALLRTDLFEGSFAPDSQ